MMNSFVASSAFESGRFTMRRVNKTSIGICDLCSRLSSMKWGRWPSLSTLSFDFVPSLKNKPSQRGLWQKDLDVLFFTAIGMHVFGGLEIGLHLQFVLLLSFLQKTMTKRAKRLQPFTASNHERYQQQFSSQLIII